MNQLQTVRKQLRGLGRGALVGMLTGLMATQGFAMTGLSASSEALNQPSSGSVSTTDLSTNAIVKPAFTAPANLLDLNKQSDAQLPEAPQANESASLNAAPKFDPIISEAAQDGQSLQSTSTTNNNKKIPHPGWLILAGVGGAAVGMGAYIYSIKTSATGERTALGTLFMAPGAAAVGLGFFFAFHQSKK
jgi:hypothetical protein